MIAKALFLPALAARFPKAEDFLRICVKVRIQRRDRHGWYSLQPIDGKYIQSVSHESAETATFSRSALLNAARWCYWAVLFSEVIYTYHRSYYSGISREKNLLFPEVIGDCCQACHFHLEPDWAQTALFGFEWNEIDPFEYRANIDRDASSWLEVISGRQITDESVQVAESALGYCGEYTRLLDLTGCSSEVTHRLGLPPNSTDR